MLDIAYIKEHKDLVQKAAKDKGIEVDFGRLFNLDERRRSLITQTDQLRSERNELSSTMKGVKPSDSDVERVRTIKSELTQLEETLASVDSEYLKILREVPNVPSDDTPVGNSEDQNTILRTVGDKPDFDFEPKPHWEMKAYVEQERAAKLSGARFSFVQNGVAQMQLAMMNWAMNQLTDESVIKTIADKAGLDVSTKPFSAMLPPMMMRTEPYSATARLKPGEMTFKIENEDLWLIGSAEHTLCAYYMNDVIDEADLPVRFVGYSSAFRREVGGAGQDTRGILRVHHFNKLEMESFTDAASSHAEHEFMIATQEYLMQQLELPYQVVLKCTFDMGGPNHRGVDIETWMPGQAKYRETHSADWMTDYQTRSLNTKIKTSGSKELAHTNDATAVADRTLIAIMENNQTADGRIRIPNVLQPFMNGKEII